MDLRSGTQKTDAILSASPFHDALISLGILCVTALNAISRTNGYLVDLRVSMNGYIREQKDVFGMPME